MVEQQHDQAAHGGQLLVAVAPASCCAGAGGEQPPLAGVEARPAGPAPGAGRCRATSWPMPSSACGRGARCPRGRSRGAALGASSSSFERDAHERALDAVRRRRVVTSNSAGAGNRAATGVGIGLILSVGARVSARGVHVMSGTPLSGALRRWLVRDGGAVRRRAGGGGRPDRRWGATVRSGGVRRRRSPAATPIHSRWRRRRARCPTVRRATAPAS